MANVYIYAPDATAADTAKNGLGALVAISAAVSEELVTGVASGAYTARVEISVKDRRADKLVDGAIVKLSTPTGPDLFRVDRTEKTLTRIVADCSHLTSDLRHSLVLNRAWLDKTLTEAWPDILAAGQDQRFSGMSDITDIASMRLVRSNVLAGVIGRQDNSVINRWGGELYRHAWALDMLRRRGADRHVHIRYGKNLIGINEEIDDRDTFNSVVATYLIGDTVAKEMAAIDSPLAAAAPLKKTVAMHFGDIRVGQEVDGVVPYPTEAAAEAEVADRVAQMWLDGADKPRATCRVEFIDLRRTEEYKHLNVLEKIEIGDTIRAILPGRVDIAQRVIAYEWDALQDKYISLTLGSPRPTIGAWRNQLDNQLRTEIDRALTMVAGPMIDAVLSLNQTYVNALGYYKTDIRNEATGAIQTYLHDKPELEASLFIATIPEAGSYMWTESGWNNGSPIWTQGVTKEGNLVIRFISAVGINAEWVVLSSGADVEESVTTLTAKGLELEERANQADGSVQQINASLGIVDGQLQTVVTDLTAVKEIQTKVLLDQTSWQVVVEAIQAETGQNTVTLTDVRKFMRFDDDFLTLGQSGDPLEIQVTNEAINFRDGGEIVAWITGQQLHISSAVVEQSLTVGNHVFRKHDAANITVVKWVNG